MCELQSVSDLKSKLDLPKEAANSDQSIGTHYAEDAVAANPALDTINTSDARTLDEVFRERVRRSPEKIAYSQYDHQRGEWYGVNWAEMASQVERWQVALNDQGLEKGDRIAICHRNSIEWVVFDQAALRLGLVVVPLYTADRADNMAFVIADSGAKIVLFENPAIWRQVAACDDDLSALESVLVLRDDESQATQMADAQTQWASVAIRLVSDWLPEVGAHLERGVTEPDDLASIVYTSGTTGRPKGVMLSHKNMLCNAYSGMRSVALKPTDRLLSFLPLSHTLERTVGYYAAMLSGASVTYNRSIKQLSDDLLKVQPTVLISVPRIFERVHNQIYRDLENQGALQRYLFKRAIKVGWHRFQYLQGQVSWHPRLLLASLLDRLIGSKVRERLGGQLDFVIVGGAPLSLDVAKTFISLGVPLLQGYGLTESSPVVSVNTKLENRPDSIGLPLRGVEVKLMDNDELWVKADSVMLGYWGLPEATAKTMRGEWLKTGDRASIDKDGFIRIIGRIKDILVLANGEKVPPPDIEAAIMRDSLFDQVLVVGEGRAYLSLLCVVDIGQWQQLCNNSNLASTSLQSRAASKLLLARIAIQMDEFPGYAKVRAVHAMSEAWTVESGLLTPTLKKKRPQILTHYAQQIEALYAGHGIHKS